MSPEPMSHPDPVTLTAHAAGLLDADEARGVDGHLAGCGTCGATVGAARADFERMSRAMEAPVPDGLAARTGSHMRRRGPPLALLAAAAAALVIAAMGTVVAALYRRVASLEERLARDAAPPAARGGEALALADILNEACAAQIDRRALELAESATLGDDQSAAVRQAVARATLECSRQLGRYLAGDATAEDLAGRDLLAALDRELGAVREAVLPALERRQAAAAAELVHATVEDVAREVGASEEQCDRMRRALLRTVGERRDLAFLPGPMLDAVRRIEFSSERGWRRVIAAELDDAQRSRLETYARAQKTADEEVRAWLRSQARKS